MPHCRLVTQSLTALHGPGAADACIAGEQQDVVLPLMIALSMVMLNVFAQVAPQGALAKDSTSLTEAPRAATRCTTSMPSIERDGPLRHRSDCAARRWTRPSAGSRASRSAFAGHSRLKV